MNIQRVDYKRPSPTRMSRAVSMRRLVSVSSTGYLLSCLIADAEVSTRI